jgi:hypothetical protein
MANSEVSAIGVKASSSSGWTDKRGIATHLKCSVRHITNQQRRRRIPFNRIGRCIRFNIASVDAALRASEVKSIGSFSFASTPDDQN